MAERFGIYFTFDELKVLKKVLYNRADVASLPENELDALKSAVDKIRNMTELVAKELESGAKFEEALR